MKESPLEHFGPISATAFLCNCSSQPFSLPLSSTQALANGLLQPRSWAGAWGDRPWPSWPATRFHPSAHSIPRSPTPASTWCFNIRPNWVGAPLCPSPAGNLIQGWSYRLPRASYQQSQATSSRSWGSSDQAPASLSPALPSDSVMSPRGAPRAGQTSGKLEANETQVKGGFESCDWKLSGYFNSFLLFSLPAKPVS